MCRLMYRLELNTALQQMNDESLKRSWQSKEHGRLPVTASSQHLNERINVERAYRDRRDRWPLTQLDSQRKMPVMMVGDGDEVRPESAG